MDKVTLKVLARELMDKHGLVNWKFRVGDAKRVFGTCRWSSKLITVSGPLAELNSDEEVKDTILHEIAHALCPPRSGHGPQWRAKCIEVGCRPKRCYSGDVKQPEKKYKGICPTCSREILRYRRMDLSCSKCSQGYSREHAFVWSTIS